MMKPGCFKEQPGFELFIGGIVVYNNTQCFQLGDIGYLGSEDVDLHQPMTFCQRINRGDLRIVIH